MGVLDRAKKTIEWHGKSASSFDPSSLNDTIADSTQWTPLRSENSNVVCLYRAQRISNTRIEFVPPKTKPYFSMTFIGIGTLLIIGGAVFGIAGIGSSALYGMSGTGLACCVIGTLGMMFKDAPLVLDASSGCELVTGTCKTEQIHAVQIVPKKAYRDMVNSSEMFYNFEINLVMKDAKRLYVLAHWNIDTIREDAVMLSESLGIPLWDTSYDLDITEKELLDSIKQMNRK